MKLFEILRPLLWPQNDKCGFVILSRRRRNSKAIKMKNYVKKFIDSRFSSFRAIRGNNIAIGLDICPTEIKIRQSDKEFSVTTPIGAVSDGVITNKIAVAKAIRDLIETNGISARDVVTQVGGRSVLLHLTHVPSMGPEGIKNAVKDEASKYMIFAGCDLLADFFVLEEIREGGLKRLKILSCVAKKEIIDSYIETIKLAGLKLQAIEAGPISLARAAFSQGLLAEGIVIFTAIEADSAEIFIFNEGKINYLHSVDILEELDAEIESIAGYCKDNFGENAVIKKVMSTDSADISIVKGLGLRENGLNTFPVKVNLLPLEEIKLKEFYSRGLLLAKAVGVLIVILVLYFFFLRFQTWVLFKKANVTQAILKTGSPAFDELLTLEEMDRKYSKEIHTQEKIISEAKEEEWTRILQELKKIIPKNAYLFSMSANHEGIINFKGEAIDQNTVFDFVQSLKASEFFKDAQLKESKDAEIKTEEGHAFFEIQCGLARLSSRPGALTREPGSIKNL